MINKKSSLISTKSNQNISKWIWFAVLTPAAIALIERLLNLDIVWFRAINRVTSQFPDQLWTSLSLLGNGWACFALAFPLLIYAPRILFAGIFSGLFTSLLAKPIKLLINTPRPAGLLDPNSFHIVGEHLHQAAMPSGHTTTAFAIFTAIFLSIKSANRINYLWLLILPILTGVSRIAVGAHWPEDVLIGASLGILSGLLGASLAKNLKEKYLKLGNWPSLIILLGSFVCCHILLTTSLDFDINLSIQYSLVFVLMTTWVVALFKSYTK